MRLSNIVKTISGINLKDSLKTLDSCDVLLFCHDADRGLSLNGKAYSPILDSVREDLEGRGFKCQTVARPWSVLVENKGHGYPLAMNRNYFMAMIKNKIFKLISKDSHGVINGFFFELYKTIMDIANPRIVISIGACDVMCRAARVNKIFHVEILHGVGYTFLPWKWEEKEIMNLPQGILSLDEVSAKSFSPLQRKGIDIKVIPHPFIKRFIGPKKNIHPEWIINNSIDYSKQIIFSFSWGYAGDHGDYEEFAGVLRNGLFPDVLYDVVRYTRSSVFWRFRLHPVQLRQKKYNYVMDFMDDFVANNQNCEWRESSRMPYPSLAAVCDGNISMNSMSCYDAAYMGVTSLILCPTVQPGGIYSDYFEDLVAQGYVTKELPRLEMIRDWVNCAQKRQPLLSNLLDESQWEEAVEWMFERSNERRQ